MLEKSVHFTAIQINKRLIRSVHATAYLYTKLEVRFL